MAVESVLLSDIRAARRRVGSGVIETPGTASIPLSEITGSQIVCTVETRDRAHVAALRRTPVNAGFRL